MAKSYVYYPRGYRLPVADEKDVASEGDSEVNRLFEEWRSTNFKESWDYISRLIGCAKRLIPDIDNFMLNQRSNARLNGYNYEYLYEIVNFIESGHHNMAPLTALELMDDGPRAAPSTRDVRNKTVPWVSFPDTAKGRSYLTYWLGQHNGVEDIVCTLYVLFGSKRG